MSQEKVGKQGSGLAAVLVIYLLGLLIGGLYVGMITPARTVIQHSYGIDDSMGIWMINIYTLFYAALIPTIGKLADRYGRKRIFTICVVVFCVGSIVCGLSKGVGLPLLLFGRVVQAAGAGGMIPVANAEMGTAFPPEKRGMALGIAAAVVGISNVLGSAVGSLMLSLAGGNWSLLFYVSIPFCVAIVAGSIKLLPDRTVAASGKLDLAGSLLFTLFVLMLLLGVKGLDFFNFFESIGHPATWVPLVIALASLPVFRLAEKKADDPIFSLAYFHNRQILVTMIVSFFIGCSIISMVLIPEFAEFALGLPAGEGGYYVIAIGVLSFFGPPLAGKFIDRFGPKPVLDFGLGVMVVGYLLLAFVAAVHPVPVVLVVCLAVVGLGMGFAMGAPTNYMILENTDPKDSTSAIATVTLVRQVGTSLAPAVLVGFIGQGTGLLGFQQMLVCVAVFNALSLVCMCFYNNKLRG